HPREDRRRRDGGGSRVPGALARAPGQPARWNRHGTRGRGRPDPGLRRRRLMDVVLVGLPGSGKSAAARRLAARHGAALIDTDAEVEREAGLTIPAIFEAEGEAAFRARDRAVVERIGSPTTGPAIERVIATGGGTVMDPR